MFCAVLGFPPVYDHKKKSTKWDCYAISFVAEFLCRLIRDAYSRDLRRSLMKALVKYPQQA